MTDSFDMLNNKQKEGVFDTEGVSLILAGAGSGKTKVLTCRVANLLRNGVHPDSILAITFTNKAAKEMRNRVNAMSGHFAKDVWLFTFHAFCVRFLRAEIENIKGYKHNFTIYDAGDSLSLMRSTIKSMNLDIKRFSPSSVCEYVSRAKNELISAEKLIDTEENYLLKKYAEIYSTYQQKLKENNALDFDDLLLFTAYILEKFPEVCSHWQKRFSYILVDEYQDTNFAQYQIVKRLFTGNLCVVGDVDQCIYEFRGADIRNINNFMDDYPQAKIIKLEQNYRSTSVILDAANAVISHNLKRPEKELWTSVKGGAPIGMYIAYDEKAEAIFLVDEISRLLERGYSLKDIAILYRTNVQSRVIEEAFIHNDIKYTIVGGVRFYDRAEIRDVLSYLRVISNPYDSVSLKRAIFTPKRGIGNGAFEKLTKYAEENGMGVFDALSEVPKGVFTPRNKKNAQQFVDSLFTFMGSSSPLDERIHEVLKSIEYAEYLEETYKDDWEERMDNVNELIGIARSYMQECKDTEIEATLEGFLEKVALMSDLDNVDDDEARVRMMTVHSAKGLEFPVVFLPGMEEGLFPHFRCMEEDDNVEEERRLCYVGMTRAKKILYVSYAQERYIYGKSFYNERSRFVDEIPEDLTRRITVAY